MIQVSDRRLTTFDGKRIDVVDEAANKSIVLQCNDGIFAIGYTGLGEIKGERTDEWIVKFLTDTHAGRKGCEFIDELKAHATHGLIGGGGVIALVRAFSGKMKRERDSLPAFDKGASKRNIHN
jgi:hypothetical protein